MDVNEKRRNMQRQMPTYGGYTRGPGGIPSAFVQVTPTQVRPAAVVRTPHGSTIVSPRPRRSGNR